MQSQDSIVDVKAVVVRKQLITQPASWPIGSISGNVCVSGCASGYDVSGFLLVVQTITKNPAYGRHRIS